MLQPKVYVKSERKVFDKKKVFDAKEIHFDIDVVAIDDGVNFDYCELDFDEVEFMENTGLKDKYGNYVYVGSILTDEGVLGDDYWDYATKILMMGTVFLGKTMNLAKACTNVQLTLLLATYTRIRSY